MGAGGGAWSAAGDWLAVLEIFARWQGENEAKERMRGGEQHTQSGWGGEGIYIKKCNCAKRFFRWVKNWGVSGAF
jgi:hypothetical protein